MGRTPFAEMMVDGPFWQIFLSPAISQPIYLAETMDASNRGGTRGHDTPTCPNRKRKAPNDGAAGDDGRPADGAKKQRTRGGGGGGAGSDAGASTAGAGGASRRRTPAELAHLAFLATGSPFIAERYPRDLCAVVGLLSRGHRENLREAKRERDAKTLNVLDVVRSVAALEAAARVAPSVGLPWPPPEGVDVCKAAVRAGHADVLARAAALGCPLDVEGSVNEHPLYGKDGCWFLAIEHGRIAVMAWLREHHADDCHWNAESCEHAAQHGQLAALQWLRAPERAGGPCAWDANTCAFAARNGHLGVLQWARAQDPPCPANTATCSLAAANGRWDVLRWLRAEADPPCPWFPETEAQAKAHFGKAEVVSWGGPPPLKSPRQTTD